MAVVTDIRSGPRGSHRRRIFVDGEEWRTLPAEVVADSGLRPGELVQPILLEERIEASLPVRAWERALRLLSFRERGTAELARRLGDDGYPPAVVDDTLRRAADLGFLDDRRFADSLVRGMVNGRQLGRRRVLAKLAATGIDETVAAQVVEEYCDEEDERLRARTLALKLATAHPCDPRKLASRLVARGYEGSLALSAAFDACEAADAPSQDSEQGC